MSNEHLNGGHELSALHLLHRAGQCADELFALSIGRSDLTPRQFEVLKWVSKIEDLSQTKLVEATGIDRSTLADIVRRLVSKGLLQRKRTKRDARTYAVRLTAAGREALRSVGPAARTTEDKLLAAVPAQQRASLINALNSIVKTLGPISSARVPSRDDDRPQVRPGKRQ